MFESNKLPIGLLLQKAGLISPEQLQHALELQAQYTQLKLGEILSVQQGLKVKTIDFFVDKWQEIVDQGQLFPLGYYLEKACLLNEQQIEIILQEQKEDPKNNQRKFGALAVQKGWIQQDTINFFLTNLSSKSPQLISLNRLEAYNQSTLHLEKKYANYSLLLSRILAWTGGIPSLTKIICQVFAQSDANIPPGKEINAVDQFVEGTLIRKWQTSKSSASIRAIRNSFLNNCRCDSSLLLKEYLNILISGSKKYQGSQEQAELLLLGLIVQEKDQLKVSNIIYQQIFNQEFIAQELTKRSSKADSLIDDHHNPSLNQTTNIVKSVNSIVEYAPQAPIQQSPQVVAVVTQADVEVKSNHIPSQPEHDLDSRQTTATPEPLTKIASIIAGTAIALFVPLFLAINNNNYYSGTGATAKVAANSQQKINELQQFCSELHFADLNSSLKSISKLETKQQLLLKDFPPNCDHALNRLRVAIAPQLGRENRIIEAIHHLCKVPAEIELHIDAEIWLRRWYNSPSWGEETKFYLEEISTHDYKRCPSAYFLDKVK
ncbi:MAG: hypothetical protein ACRC1Z_24145 [Waterburya sp.]